MKENCNQILRVTRRVINNIAGDAEIERQQGNFGMLFRSDHREPSGGGVFIEPHIPSSSCRSLSYVHNIILSSFCKHPLKELSSSWTEMRLRRLRNSSWLVTVEHEAGIGFSLFAKVVHRFWIKEESPTEFPSSSWKIAPL